MRTDDPALIGMNGESTTSPESAEDRLQGAIPSMLRIGGRPYEVTLREVGLGEDCAGQYHASQSRIELAATNTPFFQAECFLHEMVHGIMYHAGLEKHSEKMVRIISHGLLQIVLDNPQLLDYLKAVHDYGVHRSQSN